MVGASKTPKRCNTRLLQGHLHYCSIISSLAALKSSCDKNIYFLMDPDQTQCEKWLVGVFNSCEMKNCVARGLMIQVAQGT